MQARLMHGQRQEGYVLPPPHRLDTLPSAGPGGGGSAVGAAEAAAQGSEVRHRA
jgi:hypothetical protein